MLQADRPLVTDWGGAPDRGRVVGRLTRLLRAGLGSGMPYIALQLLLVQGVALLAQIVIAPSLGPTLFGQVRTAETVFAYFSLVAALGIPATLVRQLAHEPANTGPWTSTAATLSLALGVVVAVPLWVALSLFVLPGGLLLPAAGYALMLPVSLFSRTLLARLQGEGRMGSLAAYGSVIGVTGGVLAVAGAVVGGVQGWLLGRLIAELVGAAAIWLRTGRDLRLGILRAHFDQLVKLGGFNTVALLCDRLGNLDLLLLSALGVPAAAIGTFALSNTAALGISLPYGAANTILLPRLSALPRGSRELLTRRAVVAALLLGIVLGAALAGAGLAATYLALLAQYPSLPTYLVPISAAIPFQAATSMLGTRLFADGRPLSSALINMVTTPIYLLLIGAAAALSATTLFGWVVLAMAVTRLVAYGLSVLVWAPSARTA